MLPFHSIHCCAPFQVLHVPFQEVLPVLMQFQVETISVACLQTFLLPSHSVVPILFRVSKLVSPPKVVLSPVRIPERTSANSVNKKEKDRKVNEYTNDKLKVTRVGHTLTRANSEVRLQF